MAAIWGRPEGNVGAIALESQRLESNPTEKFLRTRSAANHPPNTADQIALIQPEKNQVNPNQALSLKDSQ